VSSVTVSDKVVGSHARVISSGLKCGVHAHTRRTYSARSPPQLSGRPWARADVALDDVDFGFELSLQAARQNEPATAFRRDAGWSRTRTRRPPPFDESAVPDLEVASRRT